MPPVDAHNSLRCVVYTRTSRDSEYEQEFGSIDAQREAGLAYIANLQRLNWQPTEVSYDDPTVSGATLERPSLHRLLTDIEAGGIDVVVVYKLDRLTRCLADFSKLMAVFDRHHVSVASVTQHLNSRDAAGRLAIHTLMSFAEFERDLIGERIRDKIVATRRKGLWSGGIPPLGYDIQAQHLTVNEAEAHVVRKIFQGFVELGSMTALVNELHGKRLTTKSWKTKSGNARGGRQIDKNYLYKLLHNRMFLGELHYDGAWHPGIHDPIIDAELWQHAHTLLTDRRRARKQRLGAPSDFMLKGLVFGEDGRAYSPWTSSVRNGRCYRYYIPQRNIALGAGASGLPRLSAYELESIVVDQLRCKLRSPSILLENLPAEIKQRQGYDEAIIVSALAGIDSVWDVLFTDFRDSLVRALLNAVIVGPEKLVVQIDMEGLARVVIDLLKEQANQAKVIMKTKKKKVAK